MRTRKGFTILELLVVVAIIAILAVIAIPNFIGRIDEAKHAQNLAEINAVQKAVSTYYADTGKYPTLQGDDLALAQSQPIDGSPHNIKFADLVPNYLATLPHFSYWWVDYKGEVYHTQQAIGKVEGGVFTPQTGAVCTLYKVNGTTQALSSSYTLQTGEYVLGKDADGVSLPKINSSFKNEKQHPESGVVVESVTQPVKWDSAWNGNNLFVISPDGLTLSNSANGIQTIRATVGKTTGKWYWEYKRNDESQRPMMGVIDTSVTKAEVESNYTYSNTKVKNIWYNGSYIANIVDGTWVAGDTANKVIGFALDMDAKTLKIYVNGVYQLTSSLGGFTTAYPMVADGVGSTANSITANFGGSAFSYTPPAGYKAYNIAE